MEFVKLFEPVTINQLQVPNRIVMPSMGLAYTDKYEFSDRFRNFYWERAEGGVGLMTVGPVAIDEVGSAPFIPALFDDRNVESLAAFVDRVHRETDTKVATQLFHMGRYSYSFLFGLEPIAPSPVFSKLTGHTPREMTADDILEVQDAFVRAAVRARDIGFDLIEIIACTGYLISQFLSPVTNKRTDEYGGNMANRMRFGVEVVEKVRAAVGSDTAVGIRIAGHDFMDGGHTNIESAQFAAAAEKAGVDAINVTGGWHETNIPQLTTNVPPGGYLYLARGIRNAVSVPVFASNRLGDPRVAEKALRAGAADLICWGRPLIADPELPRKVREGRLDEIVSCIACNQGCFDSIFSGGSVHCVVNPRAGREGELKIQPAPAPKKVMVAGGGPAGLEFAVTAAQRGHRVTVYEKEDRLGGQVNLAQAPPGKAELAGVTDGLARRAAKAGVDIRLGAEVTPDLVRAEKPDVLVEATGGRPVEIKVPGIDQPHVVSAWDVLADRVPDIGRDVVVVGGSATGCETALFIAEMNTPSPEAFTFLMFHQAEDPEYAQGLLRASGRNITVIDLLGKMAENVGKTSRWSLLKSLRLMGVNLRPGASLVEITDDEVIVQAGDKREAIAADTVVLAVGVGPVNDLSRQAEDMGVGIVTIGDASRPRRMTDAIREGFEEALKI